MDKKIKKPTGKNFLPVGESTKEKNMDKTDKQQEYVRLQEELLMRIKKCYGDGALLASFYLIYYATVVFGLVEIFSKTPCAGGIVFGVLSCILFSMPIIILHAFAIKFKENFLGVCNVAAYMTFQHELPSVAKGDKENIKKWELSLYNTVLPESKYENREYFLLALTSVFLLVGSFFFEIYWLIVFFKSILWLVLLCCIYLIAFVFSIMFIVRIWHAASIGRLCVLKDQITIYYIKQYELENGQEKAKEDLKIFQSMEQFKREQKINKKTRKEYKAYNPGEDVRKHLEGLFARQD